MIYTVTLNPSLDYIIGVENFREGVVNRTKYESILLGGKGINVSLMLDHLEIASKALGFLAGFTGEEIRRSLHKMGCCEEFIMVENGFSRINVKLKSGEETEINGTGPEINDSSLKILLSQIEDSLHRGDFLVLSGSVPKTIPQTIYRDIAKRISEKCIHLIVDASKNLLLEVLPYHPFLIKPNHHELSEIFGVSVESKADASFYAAKLRELGAENVLVSMAEKGSVLVTKDSVYYADAPKGTVINSVGAGDSMVAGFLAGYLTDGLYETALRLASAAGSASAFSEGIADGDDVRALLPLVKIMKK